LLSQIKLAEVELQTDLLPAQQRVVDRMKTQPGLVVAHGLGSGKTLTSIATAANQKGKTTALIPASLVHNYNKEITKHTKGSLPIAVVSQQRSALQGYADPSDLLIVDEAHRARETNTKLYKLLQQYPAKKRMLLTATPIYNRPSDIAPLVNIAAGQRVLPTGADFNREYIEPETKSVIKALLHMNTEAKLKNTHQLQNKLRSWVDYEPSAGDDFPSRTDEVIDLPMSSSQSDLHNAAWGKLPLLSRMRLSAGLSPDKKDFARLNQFQAQTRQISGSTSKYKKTIEGLTPKLQIAVDRLVKGLEKNPDNKAVVYSNFLQTLDEYDKELSDKGVAHSLYTGNMSANKRKDILDEYNAGKIKALLISSAGGEGLDLKGTRLLQVLEPHWNREKIDQVIGRAIRRGSHAELPATDRNVHVETYLTYPKPGFFGSIVRSKPTGVDRVLYDLAAKKSRLNAQMIELIKPQAK
jgi:SNF2 family DNA or RNA helicase